VPVMLGATKLPLVLLLLLLLLLLPWQHRFCHHPAMGCIRGCCSRLLLPPAPQPNAQPAATAQDHEEQYTRCQHQPGP
jgi:hypothetical protein